MMVDFPADNDQGWGFENLDSLTTSSIDVRLCFVQMMSMRGHYVFLRRAKVDQGCADIDPDFMEPDLEDPSCTQYGYPYEDIKIKVTSRLLSERGLQTDESLTKLGYVGAHFRAYYLDHTQNPRSIDSIVEATKDTNGIITLPYNIESIWDIQGEPKEYRDQKNGRIEYYIAFTKKRQLGK